MAEGKSHVVYFDRDVKSWERAPPSVQEARPACCPICAAASIDATGRVLVQGHGVRGRQRWGPADAEPTTPPAITVLAQRRYRCVRCRAIVVVRPKGELPQKRYTASAIVLALWLWSCELCSDAAVRERASPWPARGMSRPERWPTLRRWAKAAGAGALWSSVRGDAGWTLRQYAERAARVIEQLADVAIGPPQRRVFAGVVHAR